MKDREITYREAIRKAIEEEMNNDQDIILLGEDIGQGYEGCFGVTKGLYEKFGKMRVIDTPICENSIIGTAIGLSLLGMKPVVEIMFEDFITVGFDGIVNQAAKIKMMSGDQYNLNLVIRTPGGSGGGTGPHHSQCLESIFMHIPGLYIAMPSNAYDAKGLFNTAIHIENPVLFFEHKKLYNLKSYVPEKNYSIPFGEGRVVKEGKDITLIATSFMVELAKKASEELEKKHNLNVEIIDPRTLVPLDMNVIEKSIKKTLKVIIVEEGTIRNGVGAEIASQINEKFFNILNCPVKRIASKNSIIPISPILEDEIIPNHKKIIQEVINMF